MSRENEISTGQKMINEDLQKTTHEAQLAAYKRHEMTKQLREAWTQQQMLKDNEKLIEKIF